MLERGYCLLDVKGVAPDTSLRGFSGLASTPELDRQGHSVNPAGITFTNPLPLLLGHDQMAPIGTVELGPVTPEGLAFTARIASIDEPGRLKDRTDEAWQAVKAGLMRGMSIGYRLFKDGVTQIDGGLRL